MRANRCFLVGLISIAMLAGCERRRQSAAPTTAPQNTATKAGPRPTSMPATTQATPSFIWIDQHPYEFPPARLMLKNEDEKVVALLFSDDPPNAIDDNYTGNSFYLEMPLETAEEGKLTGASWVYKAPNSERVDTVSGVFLEGRRKHLQPFDVRVEFESAASPVKVLIGGTFLLFESDNDQVPGTLVPVRASLSAELRAKSAAK